MNTEYDLTDRTSIRQYMRQQRNALSPQQQLQAAQKMSAILLKQPWFQRANHIAAYLANDGEMDPIVVCEKAKYRDKRLYLPSIQGQRKGLMGFYSDSGPKVKNKFGIMEPNSKLCSSINAKKLDVVLLPLVAFDNKGGRLGMGGGYYDRTFEFLRSAQLKKPKLIGLAHELQRVESLPLESWDIPLDAIITDKGIYATQS